MRTPATTWADLITRQASEKIVLVEVNVGQWFEGWVAAGGGLTNTYKVAVTQQPLIHSFRTITSLMEDGTTAYTSRASAALVDANAASFYHDVASGYLYVRPPVGEDPREHMLVGEFTLYYCGGAPGFSRTHKPIVLDGHRYHPLIADDGVPAITQALQSPFVGSAQVGGGELRFVNAEGAFDAIAERYQWESRTLRILVGGDDLPYSEYVLKATTRVVGVRWDERSWWLKTEDDAISLRFPNAFPRLVAADLSTEWTFSHYYCNLTHGYQGCVLLREDDDHSYADTQSAIDVDPTCADYAPLGSLLYTVIGEADVLPMVLASSNTQSIVRVSWHAITDVVEVRNAAGQVASGTGEDLKDYIQVDIEHGVIREVYDEAWFTKAAGPYTYRVRGVANDDGTVMDNPADVIAWFTEQTSAIPVAAAALTTARVEADLYTTSLILTEDTGPVDVFDALLKPIGGHVHIDAAGELSMLIWVPSLDATRTLRGIAGDFRSLQMETSQERPFSSVVFTHGPACNDSGRVAASIPAVSSLEGLALRLTRNPYSTDTHLGDADSATLAAQNLVKRRARSPRFFTFKTGGKLMDAAPGDPVVIEPIRTPTDGGGVVRGRIQSLVSDPVRFSQTVVMDDDRVVLQAPSQAWLSSGATAVDWASCTDAERLALGFWVDDDGYVVTGDATTKNRSRYY